jgi:hypothetical protein
MANSQICQSVIFHVPFKFLHRVLRPSLASPFIIYTVYRRWPQSKEPLVYLDLPYTYTYSEYSYWFLLLLWDRARLSLVHPTININLSWIPDISLIFLSNFLLYSSCVECDGYTWAPLARLPTNPVNPART